MKCSACKYHFEIEEANKLNFCRKAVNFAPFGLYFTYPCAKYCLPPKPWYPDAGFAPRPGKFVLFAALALWLLFTATFDYFLSGRVGPIARAFIFFLDVVVVYQVYSLAHSCASARWKNFFAVFFAQANALRAGMCIYFICLVVARYGAELGGQEGEPASPEVIVAREVLFSLEWFAFVSCSMVLSLGLFYWVDLVIEFRENFRKTRVVTVNGKGPIELLPEIECN